MKWIKLYEEFQMGDLNAMSPDEILKLFLRECAKKVPNLELIKVILDNGLVDVNFTTNGGRSRLHDAVSRDKIALVKLLIEAGADVEAKTWKGDIPLRLAVINDNVAIAELLIASGAKVNALGKSSFTPLWYAKSEEMKALLREHGAI